MFSNYRKESSERSDSDNWAKQLLQQNSHYHFESIEGCNENENNVVTHLLERARVDFDNSPEMSCPDILNAIVKLETIDVLNRKINLAQCFGLALSYVLYCDETEYVWLFELSNTESIQHIRTFASYQAFSDWIKEIKGWVSSKSYREYHDLPNFDRRLRACGTAWPTNIDCIVFDQSNHPIGFLEFQNANTVTVRHHCNNEYYLCKQVGYSYDGHIYYHDDIRRWLSQEILRVQSSLRLFIITWDKTTPDYVLKEVGKIVLPHLPYSSDWTKTNKYKAAMHAYSVSKARKDYDIICNNFESFRLEYTEPDMAMIVFQPPLSYRKETFPFIYYKHKQFVENNQSSLPERFTVLVEQ